MGLALVGDIGGTNARFALVAPDSEPALIAPQSLPLAEQASLEAAVDAYLAAHRSIGRPSRAVVAVAGPTRDGAVTLTNRGWTISEAGLRAQGFAAARLINDFAALAYAAPALGPDETATIGPDLPGAPDGAIAVLGPGTGLGVGGLARGPAGEAVLATEGGHVAFAPVDEVEIEILRRLSDRFGRASLERILSGPGLQNLYLAMSEVGGGPAEAPLPQEITAAAAAGADPFCVEVVERFCAILGSAAGDFALAYGARGGVLIAGGIPPRILPLLRAGAFRARFEAKGRFRSYMEAIPTRVIVHPFAALVGAARALRDLA
jgi:glucokinase